MILNFSQDGISTDGTGFISTNLARIIPTSILNGRQKTEPDRNEVSNFKNRSLYVERLHSIFSYSQVSDKVSTIAD